MLLALVTAVAVIAFGIGENLLTAS